MKNRSRGVRGKCSPSIAQFIEAKDSGANVNQVQCTQGKHMLCPLVRDLEDHILLVSSGRCLV
eukprot:1157775-Pelagomonas_calceolata.AAC.16